MGGWPRAATGASEAAQPTTRLRWGALRLKARVPLLCLPAPLPLSLGVLAFGLSSVGVLAFGLMSFGVLARGLSSLGVLASGRSSFSVIRRTRPCVSGSPPTRACLSNFARLDASI